MQEKRKIFDLVVEIKDCVINLEMNKYYYEGLMDRNHGYVSKIRESMVKEAEGYGDIKKVIQINFDDYNKYKPDERMVIKFEMLDEERKVKEGVEIESYHVILPNVTEKYYNEGIRDKLTEKLVIMPMEDSKELERIIKENMELRPVGKKVVEISEDEELQGWYDEEEHQRKVRNSIISTGIRKGWEKAVEEGREKEKHNVAKQLLKEGVAVEVILKVTSLSKEKLDEISEEK